MKVKIHHKSGCEKELKVEVPAEALGERVEEAYRRLVREVKLPGFRKGKVPLEMVKRKYRSQVRQEILEEVLPHFTREALEAEHLAPVSQPRIVDFQFDEGSPLKFVARVEIKPEFKLKKYKGFKLKRESVEVSEEDVEKALQDLRERLSRYEPPVEDREAREGDLVLVDFEGKVDGKPFPGNKAERYPVVIGEGGVLKGFEDALRGMRRGETKEFPVEFPADYPSEALAGKTARFVAVVRELKEKRVPEVDDAFARDAAGCATVAELREKVRGEVLRVGEERARESLLEQLVGELLEEHQFDVPASLVEAEHRRLVRQAVQRLRATGVEPNRFPEEKRREISDGLRAPAERNVRVALLVERIAREEGITCTEEDLERRLEEISRRTGEPLESLRKAARDPETREDLEEEVRYRKTLDFLLAQSKILQK